MAHFVLWMSRRTELLGPALQRGDRAPAQFSLVDVDLSPVAGTLIAGRPRILVTGPSLDTPVCDAVARAPAAVVEQEREALAQLEKQRESVAGTLAKLRGM